MAISSRQTKKFPVQHCQVNKWPKNPIAIGNTPESPFYLALNLDRISKMDKILEVTFQVFRNERRCIWEFSYNQRQTPTQWIKGRWDRGRKISATGFAMLFPDDRFKMQNTDRWLILEPKWQRQVLETSRQMRSTPKKLSWYHRVIHIKVYVNK